MNTVMHFTAPWCKPCQDFAPVFEAITRAAVERDAELIAGVINHAWERVQSYNVDNEIGGAMAEKHNVQSLPAFILIRDGVEVRRLCGSMTLDKEQELREWLA